jgi:hypothetical protein
VTVVALYFFSVALFLVSMGIKRGAEPRKLALAVVFLAFLFVFRVGDVVDCSIRTGLALDEIWLWPGVCCP